jgi:ZIP family zinc transporter
MNDITITAISLLIPLVGTSLGAGMVFFLKKEMSVRLRSALLGFASGVMIAASVWSLLIPSIDMAEMRGAPAWLPASTGFLSGMLFLLVLDTLIPHLHMDTDIPEGRKSEKLSRSLMLVLAVTLHNIPEGMAVGVVFAGMLSGSAEITVAGAIALSVGIAIQNFPEGAIISMPLTSGGVSKAKAFRYGFLSGVVEPIAAAVTIALTSVVLPLLPYLLAFAAGAMIYVVVEELIPESQTCEHSNIGTIGVAAGFTLMMILDIALG